MLEKLLCAVVSVAIATTMIEFFYFWRKRDLRATVIIAMCCSSMYFGSQLEPRFCREIRYKLLLIFLSRIANEKQFVSQPFSRRRKIQHFQLFISVLLLFISHSVDVIHVCYGSFNYIRSYRSLNLTPT